jgi:GT2 family glycosyltransferase
MGTQAPAVVALVVANGPAQWLDETLDSLAGQDYPNLSVLVVAPDQALARRVAARLPDAHFALADGGFAKAANLGMEMVGSAPHVLVCHPDVALAPSAVRLLAEEAYRSNAGITCPKLVAWDAPDRLLSVGLGADRLGNVHPLVEPGELDQGQHDAVREVFVAPGGAVLVRSDLWKALGGYLAARGEGTGSDLELSWRAQLAGARVVVAPQAVVRHREECSGAAGDDRRLRALWTCYSASALVLVVPAVVLCALIGSLWRLVARRLEPGWPLVALALSLRAPKELWGARRRTQGLRRVSDFSLWRSQRGSASLRPAFTQGALGRAGFGRSTVEEVAGEGRRRERRRPADKPPDEGVGTTRVSWEWRAGVAIVLVALLLAGSRGLLAGSVPHVGDLPTGGVGIASWWKAWWSGPGTPGLGGAPFGPPGLLFMGLLGALCFGSGGLAAHLLVLGPLVLGPLGAYVGARQFGTDRGRLAAGVVYAALPLPYNSIAQGHLSGLVAYAATPWLLAGLCSVPGRDWRSLGRLALLLAVAAAFAPPMLLVTVLMGLAMAAGSLLAEGRVGVRQATEGLFGAAGVTAAAFVVLLPWALDMAFRSPGGQRAGFGQLLGLKTGPYGGGLTWALLAVAGVSLFIGRGSRLALAVRMWAVVFVSLATAWAWWPAGGVELLLAPAGAALASCVALGAAAVESDLPGYRFGWRQFAPAFGTAAAVVTVLPLFSWVAGGRFGLPPSGAEAAYTFPAPSAGADYRVLWVGPPGSLPLAGGNTAGRLSYAASLGGLPSDELWPAPPTRLQSAVGHELAWAEAGQTTELGHLLALAGVRYIVVPVDSRDAGVLVALARQVDLSQVGIDPAYAVYTNSAWLPVFFAVRPGAAAFQLSAEVAAPTEWVAASAAIRHHPVPLRLGHARAGDLLYGAVPAGTWQVGVAPATMGRLGTVLWHLPAGARATVPKPTGSAGNHLAALATLLLWSAAGGLAYRRKRDRALTPAPPAEVPQQRALVGAGDRA